ncbi:hypothetical protein [Paenarthrobacter sp. NPDC018779]|uniref:hypothetical protein n=1 Tax=Paenarthrobacter sp. NPDC018779 TaxID=3364375 RepID=UPI0037C72F96
MAFYPVRVLHVFEQAVGFVYDQPAEWFEFGLVFAPMVGAHEQLITNTGTSLLITYVKDGEDVRL